MLDTSQDLEGKDFIFLNASFDANEQTIYLKLYCLENERMYIVEDRSFFKGFFYVKKEQIDETVLYNFLKENNHFEVQIKKLYDGILNKEIEVYKFMSFNVFNVYTKYLKELEIENQYEYLIKIYESYYLTYQLVPCGIYEFNNSTLYLKRYPLTEVAVNTLAKMQKNVTKTYNNYLNYYTEILSQPVPDIKRCAIDIEVHNKENKFPNVANPTDPIIACGFYDNKGSQFVIISKEHLPEFEEEENENIEYAETERELIEHIFFALSNYPVIITFNGDDFDLAYISERSIKLEVDQSKNPILFSKESLNKKIHKDPVLLKNSIHIDLFRLFKNVSLHNYGFNKKYLQFGLENVSQALLGEGKIKNNKPLTELSVQELATYCLKDCELTFRLSSYSDDLVMKLLFTIARITKATIEDIDRYGISSWARSMLYFEHRKWNVLIPNRDDLKLGKGEGSTKAVISGKKFQGALVMTPKSGAYFNVVTLDYASLYPSIIKRYNISYETINCGHPDCKEKNRIPQTEHYYCTKRQGITSLIIGVMRDLRVNYFKKLSKDKKLPESQRDLYDAITQASKVILNGSYGVVGSDAFNLYCLPVAESVTALGRDIISQTKGFAEQKLGLDVLYGDTDSLFIHHPSVEQIKTLIEFSKDHFDIDLEEDKTFKFIIFSDRKKNYFGVHSDGTIETKGLTGKKSNIPKYIRTCYYDVTNLLQGVHDTASLELALVEVKTTVQNYIINLRNGNFELEDLVFNHMLTKDAEDYGTITNVETDLFGKKQVTKKGVPMHVIAALELQQQTGVKMEEKSFVPYIKTTKGAKLLKESKKSEVDIDKYIDTFKTSLIPLLEVLGIDFDDLASNSMKQTSLDSMFGIN